MRALAFALALAGPAAAQEGCWILCGETYDLTGAEAGARLEGWLGVPLPPGASVTRYFEEGFQDSIVRARLEVDAKGLATVLRAAGLDEGALGADDPARGEVADPEWWDWKLREGVRSAEGALPALPNVTVHVAPSGPGRWTVYLTGFQT